VTKLQGFRSLKLKLCSLSISILICMNMQAQINSFCATSPNIANFLGTTRALLNTPSDSYAIGIFLHIMRRSNGTGGQTQQEVTTAFNTLASDYQPYNIHFVLLGTDEIMSDNLYNQTNFCADTNCNTDLNGDGKFDVFSPNSHVNAIDIYLFANDRLNFGLAANIPSTALVIGGNAFNTNLVGSHILSHEIGHCLGLFHTFHGTDRAHEAVGCAEFVDGSNGTTCGDFVQDTPADPSYIYSCGTQNTCTWNCSSSYIDGHGAHYNPDTHLFMAYTFPNCMNHHTAGQMARIFSTIANSSLLQNALVSISGPSQICSQGTYTTNLLAFDTIVWTYSSNLQKVQTVNGSITLRPVGNGWGTINATVTINSSQYALPQKTVWVGLKASFTGSSSVNYLGTGSWQATASCGTEPYIYEWYLRKAGSGVSALRVSNDQALTLQSVPEGTSLYGLNAKGPIVNQPITYTIFYLFLRVTDANGIQYDTSEQQIYAYGKVDLVPLELLKMNESTQPSITSQSKSVEISPNPTSTQVEVNIADDTSTNLLSTITSTDTSYAVTVIDSYGSTVYSGIKKDKKFNIPTSTFRNGIYSVLVSDGTNVYQNKLIVKH